MLDMPSALWSNVFWRNGVVRSDFDLVSPGERRCGASTPGGTAGVRGGAILQSGPMRRPTTRMAPSAFLLLYLPPFCKNIFSDATIPCMAVIWKIVHVLVQTAFFNEPVRKFKIPVLHRDAQETGFNMYSRRSARVAWVAKSILPDQLAHNFPAVVGHGEEERSSLLLKSVVPWRFTPVLYGMFIVQLPQVPPSDSAPSPSSSPQWR